MKTVLPCTREHDFKGFGGSDLTLFLVLSSRHVFGTSLCTPVWFFRSQVEKICVQRVPQINDKSCKKGVLITPSAFVGAVGCPWDPQNQCYTNLACFSVDFGISLHDWRVFQAIIMLRRPTSCVFVCLQFHELHHVPERVSLALQGVALRDEMVNQRSYKKWHKKYFSEFYPLATRWYGVSLL